MNSSKGMLLLCLVGAAGLMANAETHTANPIRKVVTMLQNMQKKIQAEGQKEAALFEKYMCYCKNAGGDLGKSIADANTKIPQLQSDIEAAEATNAQLKEDLKQHQVDRSAAKAAVAEATTLREKEAAEYAKESNEMKANIAAVGKATTAIEQGMGSAFMQTGSGAVLRRVVQNSQQLADAERAQLMSFLSQGENY